MKKHVALVHWRMAEAKPLITLLERADYEVHYGGEVKPIRATQLKQFPVVAAIIDLTRMPSYGKYWAAELRGTSMKHLPIVFVDGEPAKVTIVKGIIARCDLHYARETARSAGEVEACRESGAASR